MKSLLNLKLLLLLSLEALLGSCSEKKSSSSSAGDTSTSIEKKGYHQPDAGSVSRRPKSASRTDSLVKKSDAPCAIHIKPEWKIAEEYIFKNGDTISFGSESQRVLYPLGEFNSVESAKRKFSAFTMQYSLENPDSTALLDIYLFKKQDDYVRIFRGHKPQTDLELTSAIIKSPDIKVYDRVFIGMTRKGFENVFFLKNGAPCPYTVYSFAYLIDSQSQHFTFESDKLVKIQLKSNFLFQ